MITECFNFLSHFFHFSSLHRFLFFTQKHERFISLKVCEPLRGSDPFAFEALLPALAAALEPRRSPAMKLHSLPLGDGSRITLPRPRMTAWRCGK